MIICNFCQAVLENYTLPIVVRNDYYETEIKGKKQFWMAKYMYGMKKLAQKAARWLSQDV